MLELLYRVVAVCAGDMPQKTYKQYDIETWMPERNAYGETHTGSAFVHTCRVWSVLSPEGKQIPLQSATATRSYPALVAVIQLGCSASIVFFMGQLAD